MFGFYHCYESTPNIFSFLVAADKFQRKSRQFSKLGPPSHILVIDGQCAIHDGPSKLNPMVGYKWYPEQTVRCYYKKREWVVLLSSKHQMAIKIFLLEKRSRLTVIENKLVVTRGEREGGGEIKGEGSKMYKLLGIK